MHPYILQLHTNRDHNKLRRGRESSMGSCVSRSPAMSESQASGSVHAVITAKVVDLDGSMAQFAAPVTAHDALAAADGGRASPQAARFLCCSDELDFDLPIRAMGPRDALRPGQLYFALPVSMLERPLSAQDMAALAVKACAALGTSLVVADADTAAAAAGVPSPDSNRAQRRRQTAGRVAPVVVVTAQHADGGWKSDRLQGGYAHKAAVSGDRTVGKARQGAVGHNHKGVDRRFAAVQRLSVIVEVDSE